MNRSFVWLLVTLLFVSCGDDDGTRPDDGDNDNATPRSTPLGTPNGTPTTQSIGSGGGTVTSSDGLFSVHIPPGALPDGAAPSAVETNITIQPITNTSWGGKGPAYRLLPDGLTFATPVEISFSLEDTLLEGTDTVYVDIARQDPDGVWGVLKHRRIDWDARTLTCTTSHLSDYALVASVQIVPAKALVVRNGYQWLAGRVCLRAPAPSSNPDIVSLLVECQEDYASPASFTNWSANGIVGGNGVVGNFVPESGGRVMYHAPTVAPFPEQVTVSVDVNFQGANARLASIMTLWDNESWEGEITATYSNGDVARSVMTWGFGAEWVGLKLYLPVGRIEYTLDPGNCSLVSLAPNDSDLLATEGSMIIDNTVDPPSVTMDFAASWMAEYCSQCPAAPVECDSISINPAYHLFDVLKGTNHDSIEATGHVENGVTYTYSFRKLPRPTP